MSRQPSYLKQGKRPKKLILDNFIPISLSCWEVLPLARALFSCWGLHLLPATWASSFSSGECQTLKSVHNKQFVLLSFYLRCSSRECSGHSKVNIQVEETREGQKRNNWETNNTAESLLQPFDFDPNIYFHTTPSSEHCIHQHRIAAFITSRSHQATAKLHAASSRS